METVLMLRGCADEEDHKTSENRHYDRSFPSLTPFFVLHHVPIEAANGKKTHQIILFLAFFTHLP
jgi:hypothetical protein